MVVNYDLLIKIILDFENDIEAKKDLLEKIFSTYFFTDAQCRYIFGLLKEKRGTDEKILRLIDACQDARWRHMKKNLREALRINRFRRRSGDVMPTIMEGYGRGEFDMADLAEFQQLSQKNSGLHADLGELMGKLTTVGQYIAK